PAGRVHDPVKHGRVISSLNCPRAGSRTATKPGTQRGAKMTALSAVPGQVVLVFQGGGALGAYQGGVYQALHEAKIEPNWVIGTSIGAINGAIIAGNEFEQRLDRLREFWNRLERKSLWSPHSLALIGGNFAAQMMTIFGGISDISRPIAR